MISALALFAALAITAGARAEWPDKPVKFVSAFGPGTATDTVARLLAQEMSVLLKQPVVVENKAGANGIIAAEAVKYAAPDGYTVLITTSTTHAGNPAMYKRLPYDPVKDFTPLGQLTSSVAILIVSAKSPATTPAELVGLAKKQPGKLTFGSGNGSSRISGEMFKSATGIDILHVPYRSAPQALADLLAGQFDLMFIDAIAAAASACAPCPTSRRSTSRAFRAWS
jgi:tripartite-type tricarboxylate transporter receptor subunit TctC